MYFIDQVRQDAMEVEQKYKTKIERANDKRYSKLWALKALVLERIERILIKNGQYNYYIAVDIGELMIGGIPFKVSGLNLLYHTQPGGLAREKTLRVIFKNVPPVEVIPADLRDDRFTVEDVLCLLENLEKNVKSNQGPSTDSN